MKALTIVMLLIGLGIPSIVSAAEVKRATLYKNPQCDCCEGYASYLRENGFDVKVIATHDLPLIKKEQGVPKPLEGCHTGLIDGYVIEGHVPVRTLNKLLTERPPIKGISLPGMPMGSPGMSGAKTESFTIYALADGQPKVYAVE
jgi:hypothetical protein